MTLLVAALSVEKQGFDVVHAGCLLEHPRGVNGDSLDVNEHVLGRLDGEVNPEGHVWAEENELVFELLGGAFDADVGVSGDQQELASQRLVGQQADAPVVKFGYDVAGVGAEKEGLV